MASTGLARFPFKDDSITRRTALPEMVRFGASSPDLALVVADYFFGIIEPEITVITPLIVHHRKNQGAQ